MLDTDGATNAQRLAIQETESHMPEADAWHVLRPSRLWALRIGSARWSGIQVM
jgi:hypothetical protein